jgi:YD repeat-containing protein
MFERDAQRRLIRLTSITDSRGRIVRYGYDQRGQLTSVAYPSGETYYYESDSEQHRT